MENGTLERLRTISRTPVAAKTTYLTNLQEQRIANCPIKYKNLYRKALMGLLRGKRIVQAKCAECVGFEDVKNSVSTCTVKTCPLWLYRPYQK